ncbi:MAG: GumC family protein [Mongoliitalea sp.]
MGLINFKEILWLSKKYWYLFLIFPVTIAATIFFLTRNSPKIYDSSTVIYTGISSRKSADLTESLKIDFFTSNNLMDNIISLVNSRKSIEETGLRLLALHLSKGEKDESVLSERKKAELKNHINEQLWQQIAVIDDPEKTFINILKDFEENPNSTFRYLLNSHYDYGINEIQKKIRVDRKKSSDMIEISYYADDPAICYHTVRILGEVYMQRYSELRYSETSSSVEYFEMMLERVFKKLQDSEDRLKDFISVNKIMNYYEQGKSLDLYRKELEMAQNEALRISLGAESSLIKLEEKLQNSNNRNTVVDSLSSLRLEVSKLRLQLNTILASGRTESEEVVALKSRINQLNNQINLEVSNLYRKDFQVDGIPATNVLLEWLDLYIEKEKQGVASEITLRSVQTVEDRISEFAPLGAELKRLEREVSVNENEYLVILNGLNQARLQKENLKISQTQEIIDPAFFPESPRPSKNKLLVIGGALFGIIACVSLIIIFILFDDSLKNIFNAQLKTGLKVSAFMPVQTKKSEDLVQESLEQFLNQVNIHFLNTKHNKPFVISILSEFNTSQDGELVKMIESYSQNKGYKSLMMHAGNVDNYGLAYNLDDYKSKDASWKIFDFNYFNEHNFDLIFVLHPSMKSQNLSFDMLKQSHWILIMISATSSWKLWHQRIVSMIEDGSGIKPEIYLTDISKDEAKDFLKF